MGPEVISVLPKTTGCNTFNKTHIATYEGVWMPDNLKNGKGYEQI